MTTDQGSYLRLKPADRKKKGNPNPDPSTGTPHEALDEPDCYTERKKTSGTPRPAKQPLATPYTIQLNYPNQTVHLPPHHAPSVRLQPPLCSLRYSAFPAEVSNQNKGVMVKGLIGRHKDKLRISCVWGEAERIAERIGVKTRWGRLRGLSTHSARLDGRNANQCVNCKSDSCVWVD